MRHYQPIDCSFHDLLLDRITRRSECSLEFYENGILSSFEGRIINIFSKNGEEFLVCDNQKTLRLDKIKSLDSIILYSNSTFC